jgi:hypothetical protein
MVTRFAAWLAPILALWPALASAGLNVWTPVGPEVPGSIQILAIDPATPSTLYAASSSSGGVFKTTDGGASWRVLTGLPAAIVTGW